MANFRFERTSANKQIERKPGGERTLEMCVCVCFYENVVWKNIRLDRSGFECVCALELF